jgi:ribosomal protein S18 acetylase RimI-like enzyme
MLPEAVEMQVSIREPETERDFSSIAHLAEELACFHNETRRASPHKLMADADWYSSRLLAVNGVDVGFVGWHRIYSCQSGERGLELQNLYVDEKYRGKGFGFMLVLEVVKIALKLDCVEIKIGVRQENSLAVGFYKKLGCSLIDRNDSWRCKLGRTRMTELIAIPAQPKLFERNSVATP